MCKYKVLVTLDVVLSLAVLGAFSLIMYKAKPKKIAYEVVESEPILTVKETTVITTESTVITKTTTTTVQPILNDYLLEAIIKTESNGNPDAVSYLGYNYGIGLMMVSKIGLLDYNNWHGTNYTQRDLFDPDINVMIGKWIFMQNIYYGVPESVPALLTAYNCGAQWYKDNGIREVYVNKVINNLLDTEAI